MLLEPLHSLQKRILLGIDCSSILRIRSNRKPMLDLGIQIDLIRQPQVFEYLFGLVAFFRRENRICFGGRNGEGALDVFEFVGLDETRMCGVSGVDFAGVGAQVADDVFAAEAVAYGADFLTNTECELMANGGGECQ